MAEIEEQINEKLKQLEEQQASDEKCVESDEKVGNNPDIQKPKGNRGWFVISQRTDSEYDFRQFEEQFNTWQRQAILLTELTYAEDYNYVTPLGVFTHIGTLARALQYLFEKDWEIDTTLMGSDLRIGVNKGIKGVRHTFVCSFVELDQATSDKHCDGWKLKKSNNRDAKEGFTVGVGGKLIVRKVGEHLVFEKW